MLQQSTADDYVIATGEAHSVRDFLDLAFELVGHDWHKVVIQDPRLLRPTDIERLQGDASKARNVLGWVPKTTFRDLVQMMVESDLCAEGLHPDDYIVGNLAQHRS